MMLGYMVLISLATFVAVLCLGGTVVLWSAHRRRAVRDRLRRGSENGDLTDDAAKGSLPLRLIARIGTVTAMGRASSSLRMQMTRAGFSTPAAVPLFLGTKFFLLMAALVALGPLVVFAEMTYQTKFLLVIVGVAAAFFLPNLVLQGLRQRRAAEVRRYLPTMVDLLEVCVSGGMGLDAAWNAVAEETRGVCPILADEMVLSYLEMHLGEDRGAAIRHMADRTGVEDLSSLVAVLVQSERFGTSIAEALMVFAKSLRELRSVRAEELAEQMSVKMLFPMVVFIFPVELIVAVGPAVISLVKLLGEG